MSSALRAAGPAVWECRCWLAVPAVLAALPAGATDILPDWQDTLTVGGQALYGAMIAIDPADNIFVTGSRPWSTIVTARYDQQGNQVWLREFDNPGTREQAGFVTIDPAGNPIVVGATVAGASNDPTGFLTLKYDPDGNLQWFDIIPGTRAEAARAATDAAGNVYVVGRGWLLNPQGNTTDEMVTVRYLADGTFAWSRSTGVDAMSVDVAAALAVRPDGNVVVAGGGRGAFLTVEYDPAGGEVWSAREAASGAAADLALGPNGEAYVVGGTWSVASGNEYLVVGYDPAGGRVSGRTYPGYAGRRVAVSPDGGLVVTGYATGLPGFAYTDWLTHGIDASGGLRWSQRYDQHRYNDEMPYFLVLGPDGEAYVTGQGGPGPTSGDLSYLRTVTVRYGADGTEDWVASTFDAVRGLGVQRAGDGSVAVVGHSPFVLLHYLGCATTPEVVGGLLATRAGTDVALRWSVAVGADAYNLWHVGDKRDIERARQGSRPPAVGVAGCAVPAPTVAAACTDPGAIGRAGNPLFYQVRGLACGSFEGP